VRVLITAGGTREPIDRVRAITNTSTGATGTALAAALAAIGFAHTQHKPSDSEGRNGSICDRDVSPRMEAGTARLVPRGHSVELLRSAHAVAPPPNLALASQTFTTTESLEARLRERLARGDIDAVLMAAAVADYRPTESAFAKIDSAADELTLRLVRVPKLLPQLRAMSPRPLRIIGFKLTVGASHAERLAAVAAQFKTAHVDAVVHNDLSEIEAATARGTPHPFRFYTNSDDKSPPLHLGPAALAEAIHAFLMQPAK